MRFKLFNTLRRFVLVVVILLSAFRSQATHIFGIDLYYSWVSGNTYTVHLVVYGDCSGAAFPSLTGASPVINIYNGGTYVSDITLVDQAPISGVEVTPVCPADIDSTTCTNLAYPISGIKKFVYTGNITLTGTSTAWRFLFQGVMGTSSGGRSNSITNIVSGSIIQLVDTLNNTVFDNSSAVYTTIPTPFYCLDIPANYNPGAVDPNGDSLVFYLVPGIDASTGSSVTYIAPYTATTPIGATAGTFSFNSATGQLAFTPDIIQKALVVYNVEEYHSGLFRGTSQREMTMVVITPCSNIPPGGVISSPSAGTVTGGTTVSLCQSVGPFTFHINPTDAGGNHITMTVSGLPAGATFNIVGNGTLAPLGTFSWSTTGVTPGSYIFYINYQDDGCPLSGTQTIAYTVTVYPMPSETYTPVSAATCLAKSVFHVTPGGSFSPWTLQVIQGGTTIQTITGVTGMVADSLVPGTYTIQMSNPDNCFVDTTITITSPPLPIPSVVTTLPLCPGGSTGSATITATGALAPYLYANGTGAYGASGSFTGLTPGSYTLHVKDANGCIKDTIITVPDATPVLMHFIIQKPLCDTFANGFVIIDAYNSSGPYTYAKGTGAFTANDTFHALAAGSYTFHVKNANGCDVDTTLTLADSETLHATLTILPILCNAGTGTVTINGSGGYGPPYTYAYNTNPFVTTSSFSLTVGTYTMHIKDSNSCYFDTSVILTQPPAGTVSTVNTNILCNGAATGSIVVTAGGGTPTYLYELGTGGYGASGTFTGIPAGAYTIYVKDTHGCIYPDSVILTQPPAIVIDSVSMHEPACNGGADGSLTMYATGGVSPYTYASGSGAYGTTDLFSGITAGAYTLYVKDANACIKDTTVTLLQPAAIVPAAIVIKSICNPLATGKVTLSATGGTPAYTYAMGGGAYGSAAAFTSLATGTYTFHIKDANSCVKDTTITITDSLAVSATLAITPALCYNQASGSVNISASGGSAPYSYGIDSAVYVTAHLFSGLFSGSYSIYVKDTNGCKFDTTVSVTQPTDIVPGITVTEPSCYGYHDGSVAVDGTGGTPAYTYSYDHGTFTATTTYTSQTAGMDSVVIKDANGCLHDTVFTIPQPTPIAFGAVTFTNISCFNGSDGTITVTTAGAVPPYMYALDTLPWQAADVFSGLTAGWELVKTEDSHGCEADTDIDLTQPAALIFTSLDSLNPTCPGYKDGSVTLLATGGTNPYAYSDDNTNFNATNSFPSLAAGTFTFVVKDANGCSTDTTITLTGLPQIIVDSTHITEPTCYGTKNGSLSIAASGGALPLSFQLSGNAQKTSIAVYSNLYAGLYTVIIKDSRNCGIDTAIIIPQPDSLSITDSITLNDCYGTGDYGAVAAYIAGGTQPYSYLWSTGAGANTPAITGLQNGIYTLWVKDANNCADSSTYDVAYNDCCTPWLPDAFTPNGDGKDDIYRFRFVGDMYIVRFSIYNRFGQEVYNFTNSADLNQGWDGKFLGVPAEMGVYYYYAKIICGNKRDHIKELKGDVTLIR